MKRLLALLLAVAVGVLYMMVQPLPGSKARDTIGQRYEAMIGDGMAVWYELGDGPGVIMLASAGREASDFNELAARVAEAGHRVYLVQPPEIDGAKASRDAPDLFSLAEDLSPVLDRAESPVVFVGHAFGNRVARAAGTLYPDRTKAIILLAAGDRVPIPERASAALNACFNPLQSREVRLSNIRYAFFSADNEIPDYWVRGWHGKTARLQGRATGKTDPKSWRTGGSAPMLVMTGLDDTIATPENTIDVLEKDYPDRVRPVRIKNAGHALLPEQPTLIADEILTFLSDL